MSYPEDPNPLTGKAPEHQLNALKALSEMGKTVIAPASKKYNIHIRTVTESNPAEVIYKGIAGRKINGWVILFNTTGKNKDLFYSILEDIKKIPGRMYNGKDKYWYIPETSKEQLESFIEKYSLETPEIAKELTIEDITEANVVNALKDLGYDSDKLSERKAPNYIETTNQVIENKVKSGLSNPSESSYAFISKHVWDLQSKIIADLIKTSVNPADVPFKVGDIAEAHWIHEGVDYHTDVEITQINPDYIRFKNQKDIKLWDRTKNKGSLFDFDYPFKKDKYIVHKFIRTPKVTEPEFKVGDKVKIIWDYDGEIYESKGEVNYVHEKDYYADTYYNVKLTEEVEKKHKYHVGDVLRNIYDKSHPDYAESRIKIYHLTEEGYIDSTYKGKKEAFSVGEIVIAHWHNSSMPTTILQKAFGLGKITAINPVNYEIELLEKASDDNEKGYTVHVPKTFSVDNYLEKYKAAKTSTDFKVGDIVIATWGDDIDNTFHVSGDAVVIKNDKDYWHVKLLQEVSDGANKWPEGKVILYDKSKEFTYHKNLKHKYAVSEDKALKSDYSYQVKWLNVDKKVAREIRTEMLPISSTSHSISGFDKFYEITTEPLNSKKEAEKIIDLISAKYGYRGALHTLSTMSSIEPKPDVDDDDNVVFEATPEQKKFLSDLTANVMKRILAPKETKSQFEKVFETESRTEQLKKLKNMGKSLEDQVKEIEQEYIEEAKDAGRKQVDINNVAKMIKEILKLYFPKTKFSVRTSKYSGGHSIDVSWDFGPTDKQIYSLVSKYHDKGFDPMTDSTSYLDTPWNNDSVSTQRNIPDDYILKRATEIAKEHGVIIENITFPIYNSTRIGDKYLSDLVGDEMHNKEF